ncbi:hypothetical protein D3C86_1676090 [compost metagenome]
MPTFRQSHIEHLTMEYIHKVKKDSEMLKEETSHLTLAESKKTDEITIAKRELAKITERREKWQYMFVEGLISKDEVRKRILAEDLAEKEVKQKMADSETSMSGIPKLDHLAEMEELWDQLDDVEKKDMIFTLFKKITVNTDLTKVKGVKNKFFDAYISEALYN